MIDRWGTKPGDEKNDRRCEPKIEELRIVKVEKEMQAEGEGGREKSITIPIL